MKVALVSPGSNIYNDTPPLNLAMLGAVLERDGFEVKIIDRVGGDNYQRELRTFNPDAVAITGTTAVIEDAYMCADISRRLGYYTIMGGRHSQIYPEESYKHADCVVVGEGEDFISDLIAHKVHGTIITDPIKNLDDYPIPALHLIGNLDQYMTVLDRVEMGFMAFLPRGRGYRMGFLLSARGCAFDCTFCHNSYQKLPWRFTSPERVIEEMRQWIDKYRANCFFFIEDDLFANKKRALRIFELMKQEHLDYPWGGNARVDTINREVLEAAMSAGCKQATFGWESGNQRILDVLNKRTTVEKNYASVKLCNELGLGASGTVMIGNPTETLEEVRDTQKFLMSSHITGGIGVNITTPYPGTKIWDWCVEKNLIPKFFKWSDLDFHKVPINMSSMDTATLMNIYAETVNYAITNFKNTALERMKI